MNIKFDQINQKQRLLISLSFLLIFGFFTTSLVSHYVSRKSLRHQINDSTLPLTSDNIYSEISLKESELRIQSISKIHHMLSNTTDLKRLSAEEYLMDLIKDITDSFVSEDISIQLFRLWLNKFLVPSKCILKKNMAPHLK